MFEKHYISIDLAIKLSEVGIIQDSLFYHFPNPNTEEIKKKYNLPDYHLMEAWKRWDTNPNYYVRELVLAKIFSKIYSAFTVGELFILLGDNFVSWSFQFAEKQSWIATYIIKNEKPDGKNITTEPLLDISANTQADTLANLLIHCLEYEVFTAEEANNRLQEFNKE